MPNKRINADDLQKATHNTQTKLVSGRNYLKVLPFQAKSRYLSKRICNQTVSYCFKNPNAQTIKIKKGKKETGDFSE